MNNWEPWLKGFMQVVVFGLMAGVGHLMGLNAGTCFGALVVAGVAAFILSTMHRWGPF